MVVGLVGAFLTAAYMTRCIWLTFFGEYRGGHHEPDVGEFGYEPVGEDIDAEVAELAARGGHGTAVAVASGGHDAHGAGTPTVWPATPVPMAPGPTTTTTPSRTSRRSSSPSP